MKCLQTMGQSIHRKHCGKIGVYLGIVFFSISISASNSWSQEFSAAVFYGESPPWNELKAFNVVVVEPDHGFHPKEYQTANSELFAYVSLGEVLPTRAYAKHIPQTWVIGENTAWRSQIVNQAQDGWVEFVLANLIDPLWEQGYRGFFLDTLDSYQLVQQDEQFQQQQQNGLVAVIRAIKQKYPEAKLLCNRGFELLPHIYQDIFALAVESLFQGWNPSTQEFTPVLQQARDWLLEQLSSFREQYNLPIVVIDYLPPEKRAEARVIAQKIQARGFIPWVTTPELDALGVGVTEVIPRKVLMLYDGQTVFRCDTE